MLNSEIRRSWSRNLKRESTSRRNWSKSCGMISRESAWSNQLSTKIASKPTDCLIEYIWNDTFAHFGRKGINNKCINICKALKKDYLDTFFAEYNEKWWSLAMSTIWKSHQAYALDFLLQVFSYIFLGIAASLLEKLFLFHWKDNVDSVSEALLGLTAQLQTLWLFPLH